MKLLDTINVIASLDPKNPHYRKAVVYFQRIRTHSDVFIPCVVIHECELVLKKMFPLAQEEQILRNLNLIIPKNKILPVDAETHAIAVQWTQIGQNYGGYNDTLIASLAYQNHADVISNDASFRQMGITTIW
jgi:predicted nucleic acid-binding protein